VEKKAEKNKIVKYDSQSLNILNVFGFIEYFTSICSHWSELNFILCHKNFCGCV
jgi:hypothetical protein